MFIFGSPCSNLNTPWFFESQPRPLAGQKFRPRISEQSSVPQRIPPLARDPQLAAIVHAWIG
jgi:hypothetical protein